MKVLELFAGTRSIGKAFEEKGHDVFSIEWDKQFENIDLYADIMTITADEIISKFGADTLRFSLINGVAAGSDMRFSDEKIEGARNFMNKIWNASRFVLMNLEGVDDKPIDKSKLTLVDKWILNQLNETAKLYNDAAEAKERQRAQTIENQIQEEKASGAVHKHVQLFLDLRKLHHAKGT